MKRLFCLLLTVVLCLSFAGCKEEKTKEADLDIAYFADLGQMPECEYSLGTESDKIEAEYVKQAEEDEEYYYNIQEGKSNVLIENGTYKFYYKKDKKDEGIGYLVSFDTAYGFEIGTVSLEVKEALGDFKYTEEKLNEKNSFFLLGAQNGSVIKCQSKKNTVMFVFDNNALCATAIYTNDWE